MTMPETPNFRFKLPPDRYRGWGQFYRDAMTTVDTKIKEALDLAAGGGNAMAALTAHLASAAAHHYTSITGLVDALAAKAALGHTHQMSEIGGLIDEINALKARVYTLETSGGGTGTNPGTVTVDFSFQNYGAGANAVTFAGTASTTNGHGIVAYEWAFGDGQTGTGQNISHTYATPGSYQVSLLARDSSGSIKSVTKSVEVLQTRFGFTEMESYQANQAPSGTYGAASYPRAISYHASVPANASSLQARMPTPAAGGRAIQSATLVLQGATSTTNAQYLLSVSSGGTQTPAQSFALVSPGQQTYSMAVPADFIAGGYLRVGLSANIGGNPDEYAQFTFDLSSAYVDVVWA